jgi:hypothetical protein
VRVVIFIKVPSHVEGKRGTRGEGWREWRFLIFRDFHGEDGHFVGHVEVIVRSSHNIWMVLMTDIMVIITLPLSGSNINAPSHELPFFHVYC